jgi:hypothetical protein
MRHAPATKVEGKDPPSEMTIEGPLVAPGTYQVALDVGGQRLTESFEVVVDPRTGASQEDMQEQFDLLMKMHQKVNQTIGAINRMRDLRGQLDGWKGRAEGLAGGKSIAEPAAALKEKVLEIEKTILIPDLRAGWADSLNQGSRLLEQLLALPDVVTLGDYRPTDQVYTVFEEVCAKIDEQLDQLGHLIETDLAALNATIGKAGVGALVPKSERPAAGEAEAAGAEVESSTLPAHGGEGAGEGGPAPG